MPVKENDYSGARNKPMLSIAKFFGDHNLTRATEYTYAVSPEDTRLADMVPGVIYVRQEKGRIPRTAKLLSPCHQDIVTLNLDPSLRGKHGMSCWEFSIDEHGKPTIEPSIENHKSWGRIGASERFRIRKGKVSWLT